MTPSTSPLPGLERLEALLERGDELLREPALDEEAIRADARLTGVEELHRRCALGRVHGVGVVEHDERRVAAELHADALDLRGRLLRDELADLGRARERDLAHLRVGDQLATDVLGIARGDEVHHSLGNADLLEDLEHLDREERRLLRGLDHDRATGGERGRDLARQHRHRVVPRSDRADHADRLAQHEEPLIGARRRDRLAVHALRLFREPQQEVGRVPHLVAGHADRLALLFGHELGQRLAALEHELIRLVEVRRPFVGGARRPRFERGGGGIDRGPHVLDAGVGDRIDDLAGGRVRRLEGAARGGRPPFPVDVQHVPTLPPLIAKGDARAQAEIGTPVRSNSARAALIHPRSSRPRRPRAAAASIP